MEKDQKLAGVSSESNTKEMVGDAGIQSVVSYLRRTKEIVMFLFLFLILLLRHPFQCFFYVSCFIDTAILQCFTPALGGFIIKWPSASCQRWLFYGFECFGPLF